MLKKCGIGTFLRTALAVQCVSPASAFGQTAEEIKMIAEDSAAGCYEVAPIGEGFDGLGSIERRIWLTLEELARDSDASAPVFVARPAPGQRAGSFPSTRWTVAESGTSVAIRWGSGVVFVVVVFPLGAEEDDAVDGLATYHSDTFERPDSARVRVTRFNC